MSREEARRKNIMKSSRIVQGHKMVYAPECPLSQRSGYIFEHRLIWYRHYGKIPNGYVIHHKDENKLNNKITNLELIPRDIHSLKHFGSVIFPLGTKKKEAIKILERNFGENIVWREAMRTRNLVVYVIKRIKRKYMK